MKKIIMLYCFFAVCFTPLISYAQNRDSLNLPKRDSYGDLNSESLKPGEFPGSIYFAKENVSLRVGGLIKAMVLYDTKFDRKEEVFLPGLLTPALMNQGQFYAGARSSRLFIDGRVTTKSKLKMQGYLEMDFRGVSGITLRHAYLKVTNKKFQSLLFGQFWSLFMDLAAIPEGLVEPTVSGGSFARHGQIRLSQPVGKEGIISISAEEPANNDFAGIRYKPVNSLPDVVAAVVLDPSKVFHFSIAGVGRFIRIQNDSSGINYDKTGYAVTGGFVINSDANNKFIIAGIYADGASNYMLGATPLSGGFFTGSELELQKLYGGFASYRHKWSSSFRSNLTYSILRSDPVNLNPGSSFKRGEFIYLNSFWRAHEYLTFGVEYIYGSQYNYNGPTLINSRYQFAIQLF